MKKFLTILFLLSILIFIFSVIIGTFIARPTFENKSNPAYHQQVSAQVLKDHVIHISENLSPRSSDDLDNLNKAASYIKQNLEKYSQNVSYQNYNVVKTEYKNIIANFGPESNDIIVIGAHYDAYEQYAGADDNASGVAGLLELAKLLSQVELKSQVQLVAYTLEEPPFFRSEYMGSYIHAESVKDKNIKLMISLEMIGYFTDKEDSQDYPISLMKTIYPSKGNFIAIIDQLISSKASDIKKTINTHTDLPAYSINAPSSIPGIDFSDHLNYWKFGFPAVMVTDSSFYRYQYYHTEDDTYEKLDYQAMAKVVYGVFKSIEEID
jgi:Zn-dependent M28 family amino/carboxypeptidase